MTIARVTAHDGVGGSSATFGGTPTSGNLLFALTGDADTNTTITGWTKITSGSEASIGGLCLFAKTAAGTEGTITPSGAFVFQTSVCEYSGVRNPFAQDGTAGSAATSSGTSLASSAISTTDSGSLLFYGVLFSGAVTNLAFSGGVSSPFLTNSGLGLKGNAGQYLPAATVSGFQSTASWTTGAAAILLVAGFKPPVVTTNIKTIGGLAKASVKTVGGLALASVKSIEGLT